MLKESWLAVDDYPVSLLEYVTTFKTHELVRKNNCVKLICLRATIPEMILLL